MVSPLVLTYDNRSDRQLHAHRRCADADTVRYAVVVKVNPKHDFGDARCGICQQRLTVLAATPQPPPLIPAAPTPVGAALPERKPLANAAPRNSGADDIVWARRIGTTRNIVAHRYCVGSGYTIVFSWWERKTPYAGQPRCDICGKGFRKSPGASPVS